MIELDIMIKAGRFAKSIDIGKLDPYQKAFFLAKTQQDSESFQLLARSVIAVLPTGVHSRRGIEKLVRGFFGHSFGRISVRKDLRCTNDQAAEYHRVVRIRMTEIKVSLKSALEKMVHVR